MGTFSVPPDPSEDSGPLIISLFKARSSAPEFTDHSFPRGRETSLSMTMTPEWKQAVMILMTHLSTYPSVKHTFRVWESTYRGASGAGQTRLAVSSGGARSAWHAGLAWEAGVSFVAFEPYVEVDLTRLALGSRLAHEPRRTLRTLQEQNIMMPPAKTLVRRATQSQQGARTPGPSGNGHWFPRSLSGSQPAAL